MSPNMNRNKRGRPISKVRSSKTKACASVTKRRQQRKSRSGLSSSSSKSIKSLSQVCPEKSLRKAVIRTNKQISISKTAPKKSKRMTTKIEKVRKKSYSLAKGEKKSEEHSRLETTTEQLDCVLDNTKKETEMNLSLGEASQSDANNQCSNISQKWYSDRDRESLELKNENLNINVGMANYMREDSPSLESESQSDHSIDEFDF